MFVRQHVGSNLVKTRLTHHGSLRRTYPLFSNEKRDASTSLSPKEIFEGPVPDPGDGTVIVEYDWYGRMVGEKRRARLVKEAKERGRPYPSFRTIKYQKDKLPDTGPPIVLYRDASPLPGSYEISSYKPKLKEKEKQKDRLASSPQKPEPWDFLTKKVRVTEPDSTDSPIESDALTPTTTEVPPECDGRGDSVEESWGADGTCPGP